MSENEELEPSAGADADADVEQPSNDSKAAEKATGSGHSQDDELLSEAELDALRESTGDGETSTAMTGGLRSYDFRDPAHVLSVRLPGLESVNERMGMGFQSVVNRLMRRPVQIATADVLMSKLIDYRNSLPLPASTHSAALPGRDGVVLVTLEAALVFMLVDGYYGGAGRIPDVIPDREFSAAEQRIIDRMVGDALTCLRTAWSPVVDLQIGPVQDTRCLSFAPGLKLDEILVVSKFQISNEVAKGELHVAMPYAVLDELRPLLVTGGALDALASDAQWRQALADRVMDTYVDVRGVLAEVSVPLSDLMRLKTGDFIPIRRRDGVVLLAEDKPIFEGTAGAAGGAAAATVVSPIRPARAIASR